MHCFDERGGIAWVLILSIAAQVQLTVCITLLVCIHDIHWIHHYMYYGPSVSVLHGNKQLWLVWRPLCCIFWDLVEADLRSCSLVNKRCICIFNMSENFSMQFLFYSHFKNTNTKFLGQILQILMLWKNNLPPTPGNYFHWQRKYGHIDAEMSVTQC